MGEFTWIIHAFASVMIIYIFCKALHLDIVALTKILFTEFREIASKKTSLGAVNALGVIAVTAVGIATLVALEVKLFLKITLATVAERSASLIPQSFTVEVLFFCVLVVVLLSIAAVYLNERGPPKS